MNEINNEAGFEMHGWVSNVPRILDSVPAENQASDDAAAMTLCDPDQERVLGLKWDRKLDTLGFNVGIEKIPDRILRGAVNPSKREFLRIAMSVFDPLGFLSPFTVRARIIMQEIWLSGVVWDAPLREEQQGK